MVCHQPRATPPRVSNTTATASAGGAPRSSDPGRARRGARPREPAAQADAPPTEPAADEPDISEDYDLWVEQPGQDDRKLEPGEIVALRNGMHFASVQRATNPG